MALFWNVLETSMLCTQLYSLFGDHILRAGNYYIESRDDGCTRDNHQITSDLGHQLGSLCEEDDTFHKKIYEFLAAVWDVSKYVLLFLNLVSILLKLL